MTDSGSFGAYDQAFFLKTFTDHGCYVCVVCVNKFYDFYLRNKCRKYPHKGTCRVSQKTSQAKSCIASRKQRFLNTKQLLMNTNKVSASTAEELGCLLRCCFVSLSYNYPPNSRFQAYDRLDSAKERSRAGSCIVSRKHMSFINKKLLNLC